MLHNLQRDRHPPRRSRRDVPHLLCQDPCARVEHRLHAPVQVQGGDRPHRRVRARTEADLPVREVQERRPRGGTVVEDRAEVGREEVYERRARELQELR